MTKQERWELKAFFTNVVRHIGRGNDMEMWQVAEFMKRQRGFNAATKEAATGFPRGGVRLALADRRVDARADHQCCAWQLVLQLLVDGGPVLAPLLLQLRRGLEGVRRMMFPANVNNYLALPKFWI